MFIEELYYECICPECICPEPERRNITNISVCRNDTTSITNISACKNDTAPQFMITFDKDNYYEGELVKASVTPNRVVYFNSWILYKEVNGSFIKYHTINGSERLNCTAFEWNRSLGYGNYILGFCYSLTEGGQVECIYKGFKIKRIKNGFLTKKNTLKLTI